MYFRRALAALLTVGLCGCGKQAAGPPPRYAVIRFENLSGDPALEWTARAASDLLTHALSEALDGPVLARPAISRVTTSLGPHPAGAPGISAEREAAQIAGATRVITGYVEKTAGGVRVSGTEEDLATRRTVRSLAAVERDPVQAVTHLAREFSAKAAPPRVANEEALRLYFTSREMETEKAVPVLEQAIATAPDFGEAWVALAEARRALGDRAGAASTIAKARERKLDKLDSAYLDFLAATLDGEQGSARLEALKRVSDLSPDDTVLLRSLAETEAAGGQFGAAARSWRKLAEILPADGDALNQLGYTLAWSGDYAGAVAAMQNYARVRAADPNPLDSLGDVHYMYRKFPEAAQTYLRNHAIFPDYQAGGDLYKAAWAKFMAGDKAGAEAMFAQFGKAREKVPGFPLVAADWLYRTGRTKEAMTELRKGIATAAAPAEKAAMYDQMAIFDLLEGDRAAAESDARAAGPPVTPGSFLVRFCTLPTASPAEWEARALRMVPAPSGAGVRSLAVGYALLLDGKKQAALPVWKDLAAQAKATDFALQSVYTKLKGEQPKLAVLPDPSSVNPFAAVPEKL
ncbi:MAG: tetratricopeptide repeat protein [Acidobacteriota bacterium]